MQRQVVVRTRRPWFTQLMVLLVIGLFAAVSYWMYEVGKTMGREELVQLRKEVKQQNQALKDIGQQNAECRQSVANLKQNREIDQLAYAEVERNLRDYHTEMADLKEELEFYRSIVAPSSKDRGLKIQSFKLEKTPKERTYRYKLVLIQVVSNRGNRHIRGDVQVNLEGKTPDGDAKELSLQHVSKHKALGFKFKYFQKFEGDLTFPDGFIPEKITVRARSKGRNSKSLSKTFAWQELLG